MANEAELQDARGQRLFVQRRYLHVLLHVLVHRASCAHVPWIALILTAKLSTARSRASYALELSVICVHLLSQRPSSGERGRVAACAWPALVRGATLSP